MQDKNKFVITKTGTVSKIELPIIRFFIVSMLVNILIIMIWIKYIPKERLSIFKRILEKIFSVFLQDFLFSDETKETNTLNNNNY